jgi:hypothetical protein
MATIRENPRRGQGGGINYNSIQMAKIKSTEDESHSGRIQVWLMNSNTNENDEANWVSVKYGSPFAGISDPANLDSTATESSSGTQTSYGFFAVPPDKENVVLVAFANGESDKGFWISSTFADTMTHMIPGRAAANTYQGGGKPASEVNRHSQQLQSPTENPQRPDIDGNSSALAAQGLEGDDLLGAGNSTVWRDKSPKVMGWLSPGGNQLIMDDGDGYALIRLRTASGVQLLLSETTGDIFMINKSGNGWTKVGNGGDIDHYGSVTVNVFAGSTVNVKSGGDINLDADGDLNLKAAGNVNIDGAVINLKAGTINSAKITGEISYADTAGLAIPGPPAPVGDPSSAAGSVTRTPVRGGKAG